MFQPHNYGADFVGAMSATSNMLNDNERLQLDKQKQANEMQRQAKLDAQTATTAELQQSGLRLENQKKTADLEREKKLTEFFELNQKMNAGALSSDDYSKLTGTTTDLLKETPYLPNDPSKIPEYKQAILSLVDGVKSLRTLPASNYKYSREDNVPAINAVLDNFQTLLSKDRLGKSFTDPDGSITGRAGAEYKTAGVGGFVMASGDGDKAAFTPLFTVADAEGNPLIGRDGKAVMVPATVKGTNGADDAIRQVTPEELMTKAGYAYKVLDTAEKLGLHTPEGRKQYVSQSLPQYMGEKGAEELLKASTKQEAKRYIVGPDHELVGDDGKVYATGPSKDKEAKAPTTRTVEKNGYKVAEEWQPATGTWKEVGRNKMKEPADPSVAANKQAERDSKAAIDKTIGELKSAKSRVAALRKDMKTADDPEMVEALQELADANTAYTNRTAEHKSTFGREYNPIKEVVERKTPRDITPLKQGFSQSGGMFSRRDYPAYIASAESQGWTPDEIAKAAKGTAAEGDVSAYYGKRQPKVQASRPQQTAKAGSRPPLSSFNKGK